MKKLLESKDFQRPPDPTMFDKVKSKLNKARARGFLRMLNEVKSLTPFFPVSKTWKKVNGKKVVNDIRMLYDTTRLGLNEKLCDPLFTMPMIFFSSTFCRKEYLYDRL